MERPRRKRDWIDQEVVSLRRISHGLAEMPAGTHWIVKGTWRGKFSLESTGCRRCGAKVFVRHVPEHWLSAPVDRAAEGIKPCPFCGSTEVMVCRTNPHACWVQCAECLGRADSKCRREDAIAAWNGRPDVQGYATIVEDDDDER